MRKIILLLLLFTFVFNAYAFNYDNEVKLHDYAQVFSENEQKTIKEKIDSFIEKYNMDMVVISVRYYSTNTIDNYAKEIYEKYEYGIDDSKSCAMFIIDLQDNDYYINVFNDSNNLLSSSEIRNIKNKVKQTHGNYNKVLNFINYAYESASITTEKVEKNVSFNGINWGLILFLSLLMPMLILIVFMIKLENNEEKVIVCNHLRDNSLIINDRVDKFINTNTKQKS